MPSASGRLAALFISWTLLAAAAPAGRHPTAAAGFEGQRAERQRLRTEADRQASIRDRARRAADAQAATARALRQAAAAAAGRITLLSNQTHATTARLDDLARRRAGNEAALRADATMLARMTPTLERLSEAPVETLLTTAASPEDAVAGLLVLHDLGRRTWEHARQLRQEEDRLRDLDVGEHAQQAVLDRDRQQQVQQQQDLLSRSVLAARGQREQAGRAQDAASAATAAASAASAIDEEVRRLQLEAIAAAAKSRAASRIGKRASGGASAPDAGPVPVPTGSGAALAYGPVAVAFGGATDAGPAAGTTYAAPPGSTVAAPCSGTIEFSGPFRSFGRMLIVDCGHDYRFVVSGLDRLDAAVGQRVSRRSPLGRAGSGGIYVQLRHGGVTLDPGRFLPR